MDVAEALRYLLPEERQELYETLEALEGLPTPDVAYQRNPIGWMGDVLKIPREHIQWSLLPEYATHVWDGTKDPLAVVCESLASGADVGVESATGTGKTYLAAALALWFNACFEDALVVTTAPKEAQLSTQLWKEIGRHWPRYVERYPFARKVNLRVRMKEGVAEQETWGILGYACGVGSAEESATKAQGFHAAHMLIITEETPGIDPAVMVAFKNTCTGTHNLRLGVGNPDHVRDALHQMCCEKSVVSVRISALDHPNVVCGREIIPGAAGTKSVATKLDQYKSTDHPMYLSRVRGICPTSGTIPFPRDMVERCNAQLSENLPAAWGWDVARSRDDTVGIPLDAYGYVTKAFVRWSNTPWPKQTRDIASLMGTPGSNGILPSGYLDATGVGDVVLQGVGAYNLSPFVFTERSRQELLERLAGAFLNQTIHGPFAEGGALHWITLQLESFQYEYTANGVKWRAPEVLHDDGVMALALAVHCHDRIRPTVPAVPIPQNPAIGQDPQRWQQFVAVEQPASQPFINPVWQQYAEQERRSGEEQRSPDDMGFDSQIGGGW